MNWKKRGTVEPTHVDELHRVLVQRDFGEMDIVAARTDFLLALHCFEVAAQPCALPVHFGQFDARWDLEGVVVVFVHQALQDSLGLSWVVLEGAKAACEVGGHGSLPVEGPADGLYPLFLLFGEFVLLEVVGVEVWVVEVILGVSSAEIESGDEAAYEGGFLYVGFGCWDLKHSC